MSFCLFKALGGRTARRKPLLDALDADQISDAVFGCAANRFRSAVRAAAPVLSALSRALAHAVCDTHAQSAHC
jgi:hypothetical protein